MKQNNAIKLALIAIILAALIGGGNAVFIKIALKEIPVFTFNFLRFFIALIIILPLFLKEKPKITKDVYKLALLSLLPAINITLFAFGVRLTTATTSQVIYAAVPIVAGILSYLVLKEKIGFNKITGIILGFIGTLIIVVLPIIDNPSDLKGNLLGNTAIFIAMILWAIYTILSKNFQNKYSPIYISTFFMLISCVVSFFLSLLDFSSIHVWTKNISASSLLLLFAIGVLGAIYVFFYQYAIKHGTPVIASMTLYLQPIATFAFASALLGERLTWGFVIGSILVILGMWKVTRTKKQAVFTE